MPIEADGRSGRVFRLWLGTGLARRSVLPSPQAVWCRVAALSEQEGMLLSGLSVWLLAAAQRVRGSWCQRLNLSSLKSIPE